MKTTLLAIPLLLSLVLAPAVQAVEDPVSLDQLRVAALKGDADAQLELGMLYEYGFNFTANRAPAFAWYTVAAEHGNAKAAQRRDALRPQLNAKEIEEANKLVAEWAVKKPDTAASQASPEPTRP